MKELSPMSNGGSVYSSPNSLVSSISILLVVLDEYLSASVDAIFPAAT